MKNRKVKYSLLLTAGKVASYIIYVLVRFVLRYRFDVLKKNFENSFPQKSEAEINVLIKTYYRHLGDLMVEPVLFALASPATRKRLATYSNKEMLEQLRGKDKHTILLASHMGNWEYLINLPQEIDFKVYTAYSPISNRRIDSWMLKMRSMLGVTVIAKKYFYRKALSVLKGGGNPAMVVVIADQRPAPGSIKHIIQFMGQKTNVQIGAERLAQATNAAVLYLTCTKVAQFHYNYSFSLLTETPEQCTPLEITTNYYKRMERDITSQPSNWLWSHKRWKPVPA